MEKNNARKLLRLITNEDSAMRKRGLSMAERIELSEDLFDKLLAISLWDPIHNLREKANAIIEKIDKNRITKFPKYFEPFYDYKKEKEYNYIDELCDEEERIRILKKIIKIKNPHVKTLLLDALDKESRSSWTTVEILCKVLPNYSDGNLRRKLIKLIKRSRYGESDMINCLSKIGCGKQIIDLIPLLDDKSTNSIGDDTLILFLRKEKVFDVIMKDYEMSDTKNDKIINIKRMGILGDIKACTYLENIVKNSDDEKIRTVAVGSLGRIMTSESVESLQRLHDKEKEGLMKKIMERAITKIETKKLSDIINKERLEREKRIKEWENKT